MDLRNTLNLPDADFTIPMKAGLAALEPALQAQWKEQDLYGFIQASRRHAPVFVLHDGPPYTNSPVHMGTAMNKILKDFVVKSRTMMGFRCTYVPGYDNHGLPIELAVQKKLADKKIQADTQQLLQACRDHAEEFIQVQSEQFQRLGVLGLWNKPYKTMDFAFEAGLVRTFAKLVEGGFVYRGLRPTQWSPTARTALADTEIVYKDHVSKAIYVRFPLIKDPNRFFDPFPNLYTVIWTTTPWTIPANLAVAFHPELVYCVAKVGMDHYLVLEDLLPRMTEQIGWENPEIVARFEGINLEHAEFKHPIFDRPSIAVMADYVTTEDGTGVVHTAPSHGREDFMTGRKYGLPVPNTVDERGFLTEEAGEFAGVHYKQCDTVVVDRLRETGMLLDVRDYAHSYPYAERDDQPVIFRATEQWFLSIDHADLRHRMLEAIQPIGLDSYVEGDRHGVCWIPESGHNRIDAMVRHRPDWCISRQRPWGVGIPVFYGAESGVPVMDPVAFEAVAKLVEREGSGAWRVREPKEILPEGYRHPETGETEFRKETDILDVWFDSGATSLVVLADPVHPDWDAHYPADLYLEGSDQHRGWFNTSLILGMAVQGQPPYRQVLTHGFVNDEQGRKMSKRLGNVLEPVDACQKFGADVVRYWVASVDYTNDVPCGENLLKQFGENYRTIRNTLRFLLANLYDFDPSAHGSVDLLPLDEWALEQVDLLAADVSAAYERYEFGRVMSGIHNFCAIELSKFYLDAIKDRMYCDGKDWPSRRSGQAACHQILVRLLKLLAPVLPHTAEEVWQRVPGAEGSIHVQTFQVPDAARLEEIEASDLQVRFAAILGERGDAFAVHETWKQAEGNPKDSQDAVLTVRQSGEALDLLRSFSPEDLALFFRVSWVTLEEGEESYEYAASPYPKCERSRLRRPDVEEVEVEGERVPLSARDRRAIGLNP